MNLRSKKFMALALAGVVSVGALGGVTVVNAQESGASIELEIGYTGDQLEQFTAVIDDFTAETGIQVEMITPGSDYETVMKTRMASGDMPDVFITHGWSIARYKEYLLALNDQPWFENVNESIKDVISDKDGNIYVLCVTQGINGIEYNKTVLEEAGVDPAAIHTMDDFKEACEKIKANGVTPIFIGGKDSWTTANLMNNFAPAFYTAEGCAYPAGDALKDGSFDWETDGTACFNAIAEFVDAGYFNEDFITADEAQSFEALANGECAFLIGGISIDRKMQYNPEAQLGTMPAPATSADGKAQYSVGEGSAFGIWKDSEYIEESKQLLEYLAQPEIAGKIMEIDGQLPALTNTEATDNLTYAAFTESQSLLDGKLCYDNLFDREYLPNGMWSVLSDCMMEVLMDSSEAGIQSAAENMQENYVEKFDAQE